MLFAYSVTSAVVRVATVKLSPPEPVRGANTAAGETKLNSATGAKVAVTF